jgi:hypothetical protein
MGEMTNSFVSFMVLTIIMTIMFAVPANLNFLKDLDQFDGLLQSIFTIFDASIGNYDIHIFDQVKDQNLGFMGQIYMMVVVLSFKIVLINLIVAILATQYNLFDSKSNGLYLSQILSSRDEMNYDISYGAFLSGIPPISFIQLPLVPAVMLMRYNSPLLIKINDAMIMIQYCIFMMIPCGLFVIVSFLLIPFAWIQGIQDKLKAKNLMIQSSKELFLN